MTTFEEEPQVVFLCVRNTPHLQYSSISDKNRVFSCHCSTRKQESPIARITIRVEFTNTYLAKLIVSAYVFDNGQHHRNR